MWTVATYVLGQKLRGRKRYPLVLMLEPLFRCNLACAGCGKIQYPAHILKRDLSVEECMKAVDECGAPMVSIPGGEPLLHPQIGEIVQRLIERRKYIYLCTNALLLKQKLEEGLFKPSKYLTFSVHMDGVEEHHDFAVCRDGTYKVAAEGIRMAVERGFRVTTNTTLFDGADPNAVRAFFDEMSDLGVEGMMVSPGYAYPKAPDQKSFMKERRKTNELFQMILSNRKSRWVFNQSPLFLEFLMGRREYECTPWGNPTFNIFGWQKPCYLVQDGYVDSFEELLSSTEWDKWGRASGNPKCQQCMVHCGYEPTAVNHTFGSVSGLWGTVRAMLFGRYADPNAERRLAEEAAKPHGPLVQLGINIEPKGAHSRTPVEAA
jgi:hopanoid biosynthesis associated radical SAM protein HpnH